MKNKYSKKNLAMKFFDKLAINFKRFKLIKLVFINKVYKK